MGRVRVGDETELMHRGGLGEEPQGVLRLDSGDWLFVSRRVASTLSDDGSATPTRRLLIDELRAFTGDSRLDHFGQPARAPDSRIWLPVETTNRASRAWVVVLDQALNPVEATELLPSRSTRYELPTVFDLGATVTVAAVGAEAEAIRQALFPSASSGEDIDEHVAPWCAFRRDLPDRVFIGPYEATVRLHAYDTNGLKSDPALLRRVEADDLRMRRIARGIQGVCFDAPLSTIALTLAQPKSFLGVTSFDNFVRLIEHDGRFLDERRFDFRGAGDEIEGPAADGLGGLVVSVADIDKIIADGDEFQLYDIDVEGHDLPGPGEVQVPSVTSNPLGAAQADIRAAGLNPVPGGQFEGKFVVTGQSPAALTPVPRNSDVELTFDEVDLFP